MQRLINIVLNARIGLVKLNCTLEFAVDLFKVIWGMVIFNVGLAVVTNLLNVRTV